MEKFTKFNEPKEVDFYTIFLNGNGEKMIEILGYTGKGDNWYFMDAVCSLPLSEFVDRLDKEEYFIDAIYECCKQYQTDCTDKEILKVINTYFNGDPADYLLDFNEITMETPCGRFIHNGKQSLSDVKFSYNG